jgi:hypothetical protein
VPTISTELDVLRAFVAAHDKPQPNTRDREPIWYLCFAGGSSVQHRGFTEVPPEVDEALLEKMQAHGLISIDYGEHNWSITPTAYGRLVVEDSDRQRERARRRRQSP